ncbi:uncharacterized protein METZ01_LOCUS85123 [marine metagenome]|uniref:Uncharacterized protein n=1 Tax=marine metagenome TaxID=408172 RepID=A0A381UVV8_9ZZZZ
MTPNFDPSKYELSALVSQDVRANSIVAYLIALCNTNG